LWMLVAGGHRLAWAGALLTVLPFIGLYLRAVTSDTLARTSHSLPVLSALTLAGVALAAWAALSGAGGPWLPLALATAGATGFFLYDFWYSSFGRRVSDRIVPGEPLPEFRATDLEGRPVGPGDLRGKPALYMFYRGNWCPFCQAQVREIIDRYKELMDRGVEVALISPDEHDLSRRVAEIFDAPFHFWIDRDLAAARALDIVDTQGVPAGPLRRRHGTDTVLPTVVITDAGGRVIFSDQTRNYRVRPDPEIFLRVLSSHGVEG
ncbi:MAG: peroxiredoxin family protein, partial [Anaerolineae bacterium]